MRKLLLIMFLVSGSLFLAQNDSIVIPNNSILKNLNVGDSITYYQCHVEEAVQQLSTASGQTLTGKPQRYTITEKFVVKKNVDMLFCKLLCVFVNCFPEQKILGFKN